MSAKEATRRTKQDQAQQQEGEHEVGQQQERQMARTRTARRAIRNDRGNKRTTAIMTPRTRKTRQWRGDGGTEERIDKGEQGTEQKEQQRNNRTCCFLFACPCQELAVDSLWDETAQASLLHATCICLPTIWTGKSFSKCRSCLGKVSKISHATP